MKICPKCKAEIHDDARFCLYCMTSFEEKQAIDSPKEKDRRWLYIAIAAVLVMIVILCTVFAFMNDDKSSNGTSSGSKGSAASSNKDSSNPDKDTQDGDLNENKPSNSTGDSQQNGQEGDTEEKLENGGTEGGNNQGDNNQSSNNQGDNNQGDNNQGGNQSDNIQGGDGSSNPEKDEPPPSATEVTYSYIDATIDNTYPKDKGMYAPENAIVITKVNSAAADGVYVIPDTIDGKKVAAIMPTAFNDPKIAKTVKSITLPSTVRTIWENALSECTNLTDLYIKSAVIQIYEESLPPASKRSGTLTIHCKKDCRNFDFYYYRNIANKYSAEYKEWNG